MKQQVLKKKKKKKLPCVRGVDFTDSSHRKCDRNKACLKVMKLE